MTADSLLSELTSRGVLLRPKGDRLHVQAPIGVLTVEARQALVDRKPELLRLLLDHAARVFVHKAGARLIRPSGGDIAVEVPAANDDCEFRETVEILGMESLPVAHRRDPLGDQE